MSPDAPVPNPNSGDAHVPGAEPRPVRQTPDRELFPPVERLVPNPAMRASIRREARRRLRIRRAVRVTGAVAALALVVVGGGSMMLDRRVNSLRTVTVATDGGPVRADKPSTLLVVGLDRGSDPHLGVRDQVTGARADSIALVRFDPGAHHTDVLLVPRDLVVRWPTDPAENPAKVNALVGDDGDDLTALASELETRFGVPIDRVIAVDMDGARSLVDRLGGVRVRIDRDASDSSSFVKLARSSCTTLDGDQVVAVLRSRRLQTWAEGGVVSGSMTNGDLDRMALQAELARLSLGQLAARSSLSPGLIADVSGVLHLDRRMDNGELLALARSAARSSDSVQVNTLPVEGVVTSNGSNALVPAGDAGSALSPFGGRLTPGSNPPPSGSETTSVQPSGFVPPIGAC